MNLESMSEEEIETTIRIAWESVARALRGTSETFLILHHKSELSDEKKKSVAEYFRIISTDYSNLPQSVKSHFDPNGDLLREKEIKEAYGVYRKFYSHPNQTSIM